MITLLDKLKDLGFQNLFTYRVGPCFQCEDNLQTFFNPELKRWYCEKCWYDIDFISELELQFPRRKMAMPSAEQMWAELQALRAKTKVLLATREDNVFIGGTPPGTGNVTLKSRALSPRGWGVPTKAQNGQGYFRCSDFPFTFDISPDRKAVRVYTAIPASPDEIQLFESRFIAQQLVVAKPRKTKDETDTTASAFNAPSQPSAPMQTSTPSASRSFSTLSQPEQALLIGEADKLMSVPGLFKSKLDALQSVVQPKNISLP